MTATKEIIYSDRTPHPDCKVYGVPIGPGMKISPAQSRSMRSSGEMPFGLKDRIITGQRTHSTDARCRIRKATTKPGALRDHAGLACSKKLTFKQIDQQREEAPARKLAAAAEAAEIERAESERLAELRYLSVLRAKSIPQWFANGDVSALVQTVQWSRFHGHDYITKLATGYLGTLKGMGFAVPDVRAVYEPKAPPTMLSALGRAGAADENGTITVRDESGMTYVLPGEPALRRKARPLPVVINAD